jgi:hypothetical protein
VNLRVAAFRTKEGINDFGLPEEGGANLFAFPYDFFLGDVPDVIEITHDGRVLRLYKPFRNQVGPDAAVDQVMPAVVPGPAQFGSVAEGMPALELLTFSNPLGTRADALRLDIVPNLEVAVVNKIVGRFVDWIRILSGQWWIGHARHFQLSPLRNWFSITAEGQPASGIHSFAKYFAGFGNEMPITGQHCEISLQRALNGDEAPLPLTLLFDAIYHYAAGDHRRSLIDAAGSVEAAARSRLVMVAARNGVESRLRRALRTYDLTVLVDQSCARVAGRSFRTERPDDYRQLLDLRTARGNVTHARGPLTSAGTPIDSTELRRCLLSTVEAVNWLGAL